MSEITHHRETAIRIRTCIYVAPFKQRDKGLLHKNMQLTKNQHPTHRKTQRVKEQSHKTL